MTDSNPYRRPAFLHRPWIRGALYDQYVSKAILHCDAFVLDYVNVQYLLIDWREGGRTQVALDCYRIDTDGLTPVWLAGAVWADGRRMYWTRSNAGWMAGVHKRVIAQGNLMLSIRPNYARVVTLAHYVNVRDTDAEIPSERNAYTERKPYKTRKTRTTRNTLPDIL